ncbi:MAG: hypothetical protein ACJA2W_000732 [Planctomycetota bacterium]|jgi:hypothetical protein
MGRLADDQLAHALLDITEFGVLRRTDAVLKRVHRKYTDGSTQGLLGSALD